MNTLINQDLVTHVEIYENPKEDDMVEIYVVGRMHPLVFYGEEATTFARWFKMGRGNYQIGGD